MAEVIENHEENQWLTTMESSKVLLHRYPHRYARQAAAPHLFRSNASCVWRVWSQIQHPAVRDNATPPHPTETAIALLQVSSVGDFC